MNNQLRYSLFETKNLTSKIICSHSNKAKIKKVRTGWKYQILFPRVTAEIYDNLKNEWVV